MRAASGKYVFWLEGDDYWDDDEKILKQIQVMENNAELSFCFHDYVWIDEFDNIKVDFQYPDWARRNYSKEELLSFRYAFILMSTVCFRNLEYSWDAEAYIARNADMFYPRIFGQLGGALYVQGIKCHKYRIHSTGSWSATSDRERIRRKLMTACLMLHSALSFNNQDCFEFALQGRFLPNLKAYMGS